MRNSWQGVPCQKWLCVLTLTKQGLCERGRRIRITAFPCSSSPCTPIRKPPYAEAVYLARPDGALAIHLDLGSLCRGRASSWPQAGGTLSLSGRSLPAFHCLVFYCYSVADVIFCCQGLLGGRFVPPAAPQKPSLVEAQTKVHCPVHVIRVHTHRIGRAP